MSAGLPSGWSAARLQAGWTARRLLRGRMLWVAGVFALGPIVFATAVAQSNHQIGWKELFASLVLLSGIVPPLFSASSVADEIEDRTFTYLWSRPLPRWSMLIGKLLATIPMAAALLMVTTALSYQLGQAGAPPDQPWPASALPRALGAVGLAAVSLSMTSGSVAVLMPRHGLGVAYAFLVLDLSLGAMPFSIANLSITHHIGIVAGLGGSDVPSSAGSSVVWLLAIGTFWLLLGLWRVARSEFASGEK